MRIGWLFGVLGVCGCGSLFSGYKQYCDEYTDCLDGNDEDARVCVLELQQYERSARVYGCQDDFNDYIDCMMDKADCESIRGTEYWTADDDCEDESDDYLDCIYDESDLYGGGGRYDYDEDTGRELTNSDVDGSNTEEEEEEEEEEYYAASCNFGGAVCIETTAADPAAWCAAEGGTHAYAPCSGGYDGMCAIPGGQEGTYADAATAYYYGMDGSTACTDVGGTYTAS